MKENGHSETNIKLQNSSPKIRGPSVFMNGRQNQEGVGSGTLAASNKIYLYST